MIRIISAAFVLLFILFIEHKLKLRTKYQRFSDKFTTSAIEFISLIVVLGISLTIVYFISLLGVPYFVIKCLAAFSVIYSLLVIIPSKYIDELISNVYND